MSKGMNDIQSKPNNILTIKNKVGFTLTFIKSGIIK
jgi:hypothetical protein